MDAHLSALSLWHDSLPAPPPRRAALNGDIDVDVAVVGAGYTGLWTAYYLAVADPRLRVAVLERETVGFGASGRNGGWCSALFPATASWLARRYGAAAAVAQLRAMRETVDEVGRVIAAEDIDAHWTKGGSVVAARTPVQLARARAQIGEARRWGDTDLVLLDASATRAVIGATDVLGATYTPHCAAVNPTRLAHGLATAVERRGVQVFEGTAVTRIRPGSAETEHGRVRARYVLRATEAWTAQLPGSRRDVAPVYSLMLATEPLPASTWEQVRLRRRETFSDHRHLVIYGQRTADGRLAFGGRGAPYHLGSRIEARFDREPAVFADLRRVLVDLFPAVRDAAVTHTWGGPLGVPRDWCASVSLDPVRGLGAAGGYVGDGVATSNLAGRTLADLVLGRDSDLVRLPWVGHRSRRWEPEPLRWLGVNAGLQAMTGADAEEARTGRPSRRAAAFARVLGH